MVSATSRPRPNRPPREREEDPSGFTERVVYTRRIAKVVKGGRRLRFNALVVVGDGDGNVGAGMGKALVIPDAVRKGNAIARRDMVKIPIKGSTIPHEITVKVGASIVSGRLHGSAIGRQNSTGLRKHGDRRLGLQTMTSRRQLPLQKSRRSRPNRRRTCGTAYGRSSGRRPPCPAAGGGSVKPRRR